MKFLIKENQIQKVAEKLKPAIFKYWDKNGPSLSNTFHRMFGINSKMAYELETYFRDFLVEWFGGDKNFEDFVKKIEGETFQITDGGYDFQIIVDEVNVHENQVYLDVRVLPGGTVTLVFQENEPTLSLEDALGDNNFGWEINDEISDALFDKFYKSFSEFGLTIEGIHVDFM